MENAQSVVGKFVSHRDLQFRNLKLTMLFLWGCSDLKVERLCHNVFQLLFKDQECRDRVVKKGVWCIDDVLLVVKPWSRALVVGTKSSSLVIFGLIL